MISKEDLKDVIKKIKEATGMKQEEISIAAGYKERTLTELLSKGENLDATYSRLKLLLDSRLNNSTFDYKLKYYEVIERERKALEDDKAFFKEILRSSLAVILQEAQRLASRQKGTGEVVLHSLERLEGKKKGQLVTEADKRILQIDTEAHRPDNEAVPGR